MNKDLTIIPEEVIGKEAVAQMPELKHVINSITEARNIFTSGVDYANKKGVLFAEKFAEWMAKNCFLLTSKTDNECSYWDYKGTTYKSTEELIAIYLPIFQREQFGDLAGELTTPVAKEVENIDFLVPPDNGDICWQKGAKSFTRKEVAYMLYTQRTMISNDLKSSCGDELTKDMFSILENPRKPEF